MLIIGSGRIKKFFFTPENGGREASWNLTDSLKVHMQVFLKNLRCLGINIKAKHSNA